jgi:hypothetical protein
VDNLQGQPVDNSQIPTLTECQAHWQARSWTSDPGAFHDHYEAIGWIRSGGVHITNWKACANAWERREHTPARGNGIGGVKPKYPNMNDDNAMLAAAKKYKIATLGVSKFDLHAKIKGAIDREENA